MELRDYQLKAINLLRQSLLTGHKRPILRLDCGAGKTAIASYIALNMAKKNKKMLFLTHLQEIKDQTIKTLQKFNVNMEFVDVEMIITTSHNLDKFNPDVIICDECNFALSKTWRKVLDYYKNAIIIGLSASPVRLQNEPMGDVFDDIVDFISADELINMGYLSEYVVYAPQIDLDLSNVKHKGFDYDCEDLETLLNNHKIYGDVIKYFNMLAKDKKTIVYCTTIKHSKEMAKKFRDAGYNAEHIDGTISDKKRKEIIERFRNGEIQILTNCNLISFGFDCPDIDCVVGLRPTESLCLYIQQYSRALRKNGNNKAIILDFVGNVIRFGSVTAKREWSLTVSPKKIKAINENGDYNIRVCQNCFRTFKTAPVCPYCGEKYELKPREIEAKENIRLAQITAEEMAKIEQEKKKKRMEVGMAKTYEELIKIGKERGYKNPVYWAKMIINSRDRKKPSYKKFGG